MSAFTPRRLGQPDSVVTAYDHGAHVAQWVVDDIPVVWVSRRASYAADVCIRGGIPVCWPWFANGPSGDRRPSHGVARTATWTLLDHSESGARWGLTASNLPQTDDVLVRQSESILDVRVTGRSLAVAHTVTNSGDASMSYEIALHTYLHVGDVRDVSLRGLDAVTYFDKVTQTTATQTGDLRIADEVDRIYESGEPVTVLDPTMDRSITVSSEGAGNVVVWNPGPDNAASMSDFADEEWTQMVCVETANIGDRSIHLGPGASHTTTARIELSPARKRTAQ